MRRPSLIAGTAVLATLSALLVPSAAHAVDVAQTQVVSATPSSSTPQVLDGQVSAIAAVGSDIVIGGTFTQVQNAGGGTTYARNGIAAFDATTGLVDTAFAPTLDGAVNALDANGSNVVVGGAFATVNGVAQRGLTELALDGSRVTSFAGHIDGMNSLVDTVVVRGGLVYVGGRFTKAMGASRSALAVFNASTGALTAFNVPVTGNFAPSTTPTVSTLDVTPSGSTLVIGGNFTTVGGQPRSQLALVDLTTGTVSSWQTTRLSSPCSDPNVDTYVRDITISPDGTYFVLADGGGPLVGSLCDSSSRWELGRTGAGQQPTWVDATGGDTLNSVAVTGTAVYVGGHPRWMNNYSGNNSAGPGAVDRKMVAALDPVTGLPFSWAPGQGRDGTGIFDMLATSTGLYLGSDTITVPFGPGHQRLVFFPLAGGSTPPVVQPQTLPRTLFIATTGGGLTDRAYDGTTFGALDTVTSPGTVPWATVTGAFMLSGQVYYGTPDGVLHKAPFDGSTVGASSTVSTFWDLTGIKSFTIGSGRLFYAKGDGKLYYRWFSNESDVVGSQEVTVSTTFPTDAREMFVANGSLYYARADHNLYRVALSGSGVPTGVAVKVSGTGIDSIGWTGPAAFLASAKSTTTTLAVSPPSPQTQGTPVTLTATVSPSAAAGTVQFYDGASALGAPVAVSGGTAHFTPSALSFGAHPLSAKFTPADPVDYAASASAQSAFSVTAVPSDFTAVGPCRVFDTRSGTGNCSGAVAVPKAPVGANGVLPVHVAGVGGVPANATAVVLNLTAVGATKATYVTAWPTGSARPTTSTLNVNSSSAVPNSAVVPIGAGGEISLFNSSGSVNLLGDVSGYFAPVTASEFTAAGPCRVFDTRFGTGNCAGAVAVPKAPVAAGGVLTVQVTGVGGVPANATAVVLNLTAVGATKATYVTAWPAGSARPTTSNLNVNNASAVPNSAVVPVGAGGKISLFNSSGSVNLLADVSGYFAPVSSSQFTAVGPCRVFDTRFGTGNCSGAVAVPKAPVGAGGVLTVQVTGVGGVPANATAVVLNLTAVGATKATYVTAWPAGSARPTTSNLNINDANPIPNMAVVPVGAGGKISLFNSSGSVNLLADVSGYFAP